MSSIASPSAGVARQPLCAGVALLLELELPASHSNTQRLPRRALSAFGRSGN